MKVPNKINEIYGNSALDKLAAFSVSLISTALVYKFFNLPEWQSYAFVGGGVLFFVITAMIGIIFETELIPSLVFSALITGFIMLFVSFIFGIFLMLFGFAGLILLLAYISEEARYG